MKVSLVAQYHSEKAMAAARKMRRTRQKQRTGQVVCHHLRMMLASAPAKVVTEISGIKRPFLEQQERQPQFQLGF
ncbi:MAG: hypothetical protein HOC70_14500 [Gammaproteobacteria bacterium]|jgi:hypothetical protein|nr:hypothetical protein [Gammaproteobacteria bacterium]MBT4494449.1 hypothetical protein [Gammaproteobacteria bacterium]MBT7369154.1 hypothetical protein [Gammaproteobacteria bacterium]